MIDNVKRKGAARRLLNVMIYFIYIYIYVCIYIIYTYIYIYIYIYIAAFVQLYFIVVVTECSFT